MKNKDHYSDIQIENITFSCGDRLYLQISYRAKTEVNRKENKGEIVGYVELHDDVLMRALFDAQLIEGWSGTHVYYNDSHISVGDNGDILTECKKCICPKAEFLKLIDDDHAFLIVQNELSSK